MHEKTFTKKIDCLFKSADAGLNPGWSYPASVPHASFSNIS